MQIVHINYSDKTGGAAIAAFRHNEALNRAGISSSMLVAEKTTHTPSVHQPTGYKHCIVFRNYFQRYYPLLWLYKEHPYALWSFNNIGYDLAREECVRSADVIILHWINGGFLSVKGVERLLKLGKPVIWFMHDMWPLTGGCHYSFECTKYMTHCGACNMFHDHAGHNKMRDLSYIQHQRKLSKWGKYPNLIIVAPSHWLARCAQHSALFGSLRIHVAPNVIDTTKYRPHSASACRDLLGLPRDKKIILFVADQVQAVYKGWPYLQSALQHLDKETTECLVLGNCDQKFISDNVPLKTHFTGLLKDDYSMILAYNAADVLVTPSLADNFPNVLLESLSCGTPAVGFDVGGIPDLIVHKETGYLVRYQDAGDLGRGINWVLTEADSAKLSVQSRAHIETQCSYEKVREYYSQMLSGTGDFVF